MFRMYLHDKIQFKTNFIPLKIYNNKKYIHILLIMLYRNKILDLKHKLVTTISIKMSEKIEII